MTLMLSALFMITTFSDQEIVLPWEFNRITLFNNQLYFASYTGSNIFFYHDDSLKTLTFTDDPLFVIDAFHFTPFFLYLTDGRKIVKHYLQQALSETIYHGNSITGFCLLESGDIALLDRRPDRVLILDRRYNPRISITDFPAKDITATASNIFILAKTDVIITDHHLNVMHKVPIPEMMKRIIVAVDRMIIFTPGKRYIYSFDKTWHKVMFEDTIQDIATDGDKLFILEGYGNTVRLYNLSDY